MAIRGQKSYIVDYRNALEECILSVSDRQLRLFCCACCRRFWDNLDKNCRHLLDLVENYSDGLTTSKEVQDYRDTIRPETGSVARACMWAAAIRENWTYDRIEGWKVVLEFCITELIQRQTWDNFAPPAPPTWTWLIREITKDLTNNDIIFVSRVRDELRHQRLLARDIFGDYFGERNTTPKLSLPVNPRVLSMASSIYNNRLFSDLPIFADLLEDEGYTDSMILEHCRAQNAHAHGCWVLDLFLERHRGLDS